MIMSGKSILVIGGGTGIGKGVALAFHANGDRVAIAGRRENVLVETSRETNDQILFHTVDVADRIRVNQLFEWAISRLDRIDVLVLAAGTNIKKRAMIELSPEEWDYLMNVNATGAYNCMYAALPHMRDRGDGLIVNVSSIAGKRASDLGGIAYCASKFAATGLGTAVGLEEAARGIRITNVYPGEVDTPLLSARPKPVTEEHRARMLQPADVAAMIVSIANLPPRAHVPEIVIKPRVQPYS
jgi:NAD(P)-dependent dehydrogenase (short-subunit alcohol dehydrogenase family)